VAISAPNATAVTDDGSLGLDPDTSNNTATDTDFVQNSELPDLANGLDNFQISSPDPQPGELVALDVTIRNAGASTAEDVILQITSDDPASGQNLLFVEQIDENPAGGNRRVIFGWPVSPRFTILTAVTDPDDFALEYSEANNQAQRHVAVLRVSAPDLVISIAETTGLSQSPVTLALHGTADLQIRNLGGVGAATTEGIPVNLRIGNGGREAVGAGIAVGLYAGTPGDLDPQSSEPGAETVTSRALRPGERYDVTVHWPSTSGGSGAILVEAAPRATLCRPGGLGILLPGHLGAADPRRLGYHMSPAAGLQPMRR